MQFFFHIMLEELRLSICLREENGYVMLPFFFCSKCFKRTSILCWPIIYRQRRQNQRYIHFIAWLGKRNCNCKQFHLRKILAGKIMLLFPTLRFSCVFISYNMYSLSLSLSIDNWCACFTVMGATMQYLCPCSNPSSWEKSRGMRCQPFVLLSFVVFYVVLLNSIDCFCRPYLKQSHQTLNLQSAQLIGRTSHAVQIK